MAEIGKVGGGSVPPSTTNSGAPGNQTRTDAPIGQPGILGQPTGQPVAGAPTTTTLLPDVLAGRDPSQLVAAERMRASGGASAVEQQLGLNLQPSVLGTLTAPPGNLEALRHLTPTMRRTIMRGLLEKQRARVRTLATLVRRNQDEQHEADDSRPDDERRESFSGTMTEAFTTLTETQLTHAREELGRAARMLDLLDELLIMQDYTISQMGTFAQG